MEPGRAIAETSWHAVPDEVRARCLDLVADVVAVTAFAMRRPELQRLVSSFGPGPGTGPATVLGSVRTWDATSAAFLNGSAVAADQLQDGHREARGHPASHVVLAALALAEETGATGPEFLAAVVAGYETGARFGIAMGGTPPGVHDIGTWGAVAVAATSARLLAPGDPTAAARALELASSATLLTDSATIFEGRPAGHVFLGASIQLGMSLGRAAAAGLSGDPAAARRHFGRLAAAEWDEAPLATGPAWPSYELLRGYIKQHPTCAHLHGVNDAVDDLLAGSDLADDPVARVDRVLVRTYRAATEFSAIADDELSARFSIPTTVALALLHGSLDASAITDEVVRSAPVRELAARVRVEHDPALDRGYPAGRPAHVTIVLDDGTAVSARSERPRGDADPEVSRPAVRAKALDLLRRRFPDRADDVLRHVDALPSSPDVRAFGATLRDAARSAAG